MSRNYKIQNKEGVYFITFSTVEWVDVFTRKSYRDILIESIKHCQREKGLVVYSWCLMSNHVHMIVRSSNGDLSGTIRDLKKFTSKQILNEIQHSNQESRKDWMLEIFKKAGVNNSNNQNYQFWRQDNRPIEIFSNDVIDQKMNYVHQNPVEAGLVENAEDYLYSSARDYAGIKGLIDIEFLD
ncbi:REP-associated tyrosine transposase [Ekhidna sp.]|uniref:REP-associated tyrosine transposase n=1 Tax=Ekhidna sp. TaxID=2608089 RepID=UPI003B5027D6